MIVLAGECQHEVKVTRVAPGKWGIRVYVNKILSQESVVQCRSEIGNEIRSMLRMEDKCGNISDMASASRDRNKQTS